MREKIFDDIAGMIGGAAGVVADLRDQIRSDMRDRLKGVADRIDLVTQEEHMALMARIEGLEAQVAKLEAQLGAGDDATKKTPSKAKSKAPAPKVAKGVAGKAASQAAVKAGAKSASKIVAKAAPKAASKAATKPVAKKIASAVKSTSQKGN